MNLPLAPFPILLTEISCGINLRVLQLEMTVRMENIRSKKIKMDRTDYTKKDALEVRLYNQTLHRLIILRIIKNNLNNL
jgi:hypothetical protein